MVLLGNSNDIPKVQWCQGNTIKADFFFLSRNFGENLTIGDDTSLQLLEMEWILIRNGILEMLLLSSNYLIHTLQRAAAERVRQQRGANQEVGAFSGLSRDAQCCIRFPCLLVLLHGTTYQSKRQILLVPYIPVSESWAGQLHYKKVPLFGCVYIRRVYMGGDYAGVCVYTYVHRAIF